MSPDELCEPATKNTLFQIYFLLTEVFVRKQKKRVVDSYLYESLTH